jgi:hypothetical protein
MNISQGTLPKSVSIRNGRDCLHSVVSVVSQGALLPALVPTLDLSAAQQVLNPRLELIAAFESAYRELEGKHEGTMNFNTSMSTALDRYVDLSPAYSHLGEMTKAERASAQCSLAKAEKDLEALQPKINDKLNLIKKDIETWFPNCDVRGDLTQIVTTIGETALACVEPLAAVADTDAGNKKISGAVPHDSSRSWSPIRETVGFIRFTCGELQKGLEKLREMAETLLDPFCWQKLPGLYRSAAHPHPYVPTMLRAMLTDF